MPRRILVIGAGIAGLTAAFRLSQAGFEVTVLEATDRVGGRMSTDLIEGYSIDRGAQFLSDRYSVIRRLLVDVGAPEIWRRVSTTTSGVVRAGRSRTLNSRNPISARTSGLLGSPTLARLGLRGTALWRANRSLSIGDYSQWCRFDTESASAWITRSFGPEALEYFFEPMFAGFYFQTPEETSAAWAATLWQFCAGRAGLATLRGGLGTLPELLASRVTVKLGSPALALEPAGDRVEVATPEGTLDADGVVIATTASVARGLYPQATDLETALLSTQYSGTIMIAIATHHPVSTARVDRRVYGLLVPRSERSVIAGIGIESRKDPAYVPRGDLLSVMLDGQAGARLIDSPKADVLAEVVPELERYFPGLADDIDFTRLYHWREAEPLSPIGRSSMIHEYRSTMSSRPGAVVLAGDYMSIPTTEGAAESGNWAAGLLTAGWSKRL
jgi:protoporphyrinogen/coproporphyrinogen III oxidase